QYDGTVFHHMQNYPAYASGAFQFLVPILYFLHNTPYSITPADYDLVKTALLTTRLSSNNYNYLLSLTLIHPHYKLNIYI
ncbi:hypothetical protein HS141_17235, partial [Cetobacterium somerae]|uniref:chondroitinase family polysaccharide lyase n=1 Tax=Cetobacterium somerae TaxID=188913 RepID=UPI0021706E40|nr:hypothetical protein [Cetobacterium somerae]